MAKTVINIKPGKVTLDPGEPARYVTDPGGPVIRDLDRRMTKVALNVRRLTPVRSGKTVSTVRKQPRFLKRSVSVDVIMGGRGAAPVGVLEEGSPPHEIRPRRRKALRFVVGGRVVFRQRVWHPGTKGHHMLTLSLPLAGD